MRRRGMGEGMVCRAAGNEVVGNEVVGNEVAGNDAAGNEVVGNEVAGNEKEKRNLEKQQRVAKEFHRPCNPLETLESHFT